MEKPSLRELHDQLLQAASSCGFTRLDAGSEATDCCLWFHRAGPPSAARLYVSAGIHGDEPAGPLALLELLREDAWARDVDLTLFPLVCPEGYAAGSRTNRWGVDVNRDYQARQAEETRRHVACLSQLGHFEAAVCLHEDWESTGVYVYEVLAPGLDSWAECILDATDSVLARDLSAEIDGHPAERGLISYSAEAIRGNNRPDWPEAFWLVAHHTGRCYTMETPSALPLADRVAAQRAAVLAVAAKVAGEGRSVDLQQLGQKREGEDR